MTRTAAPVRRSRSARRVGYAIAVLVNAAVLYGANRWPGWEEIPFLTGDTAQVMDWVNASILTNLVANVLYFVADPPRVRALGDVVTTSVGIVALVRIWQVFPFDVDSDSSGWGLVLRVLLAVALIGSAIGIVTGLVRLARGAPRG
ncbi:hypothetical protein GCM10009844_45060 [Nocardioides koreensis]|uniref:GtrA family protein n=1 Tax=Nocardioides koreensis TaxID=433651 RepID=A0ABP5LZI9_9ACTN